MRHRYTIALLPALCLIASTASAQSGTTSPTMPTRAAVVLPDNAAGRGANAWLRAINSGDSLQITAFVTDTTVLHSFAVAAPVAGRVHAMMNIHRSKGELVPVEIGSAVDNRLSVWVAEGSTGAETLFMFDTEPVGPHRLEFVWSVGRTF